MSLINNQQSVYSSAADESEVKLIKNGFTFKNENVQPVSKISKHSIDEYESMFSESHPQSTNTKDKPNFS